MWSYFGSKANVIHLYPPPKYGKIIEPFAGTARYALKYWERDVLLVDKYEVLIKIWKWLQQCSEKDILSLPRKVHVKMNIREMKFDCEEARMLMGFLISKAVESPRYTVTSRVAIDRPNFTNYLLKSIASNLHKIRHWEIRCASYEDVANEEATWFIDPPYQVGGEYYVHNSKNIDYEKLGAWCKERKGQVMVCESTNATWLDFKSFSPNKSGRGRKLMEGIWTNWPNQYQALSQLF